MPNKILIHGSALRLPSVGYHTYSIMEIVHIVTRLIAEMVFVLFSFVMICNRLNITTENEA